MVQEGLKPGHEPRKVLFPNKVFEFRTLLPYPSHKLLSNIMMATKARAAKPASRAESLMFEYCDLRSSPKTFYGLKSPEGLGEGGEVVINMVPRVNAG